MICFTGLIEGSFTGWMAGWVNAWIHIWLLNDCWMDAPLDDCEYMGGLVVGGVIKLHECLLLHLFLFHVTFLQ